MKSDVEKSVQSDVEKSVQNFYDTFGWVDTAGVSGEDILFRKFSPPYYRYHDGVNERTLKCFSALGGKLLMAGGGDLPETHVAIAKMFSATTFLDISDRALAIAKKKFDGQAEYIRGSILDIPKPEHYFDAAYCAHVIYHIDKDLQETAVRELIRVTRPGGRIIVIYRNPDTLAERLIWRGRGLLRLMNKAKRLMQGSKRTNAVAGQTAPRPYFFAHPLAWWTRFDGECDVALIPWDVLGNTEEEQLFMFQPVASLGYRFCSWFENKYPEKAVRWWSYPIIQLTKKMHTS